MVQYFHPARIFYITLLLYFPFVQTKTRTKDNYDQSLKMDEGYLTIWNVNVPESILVLWNVVVCEHCDFVMNATINSTSNDTLVIDTRFQYNFRIVITGLNETSECPIDSYGFSEHGSYLLQVNQTTEGNLMCGIIQTGDSSYYYTPIIVGVILLASFVFMIQAIQRLYNSQCARQICINIGHTRLINEEAQSSPPTPRQSEFSNSDILNTIVSNSQVPLVASTRSSNNSVRLSRVLPKRLRGLDTFRGFSLMIMIFVNYGGGGYWFLDHSIWNGINLADLVFPWFVWMMGASVVLSQRSLRSKGVTAIAIFLKILKRTFILFMLGLLLQGGYYDPKTVRILGVLQRLALCYFFTAMIVLLLDPADDDPHSSTYPIGHDVVQPLRIELHSIVLQFWKQWICIALITATWLIITFVPTFGDCPRGYVGPGGYHEHGKYQNCTGGMAGYVDRLILGADHLYDGPTCKEVYNTKIPYDPEGLLGILTGILLCYLGVHAAHCFVHSTRISRVCGQWIISSLVTGTIGLILSKGAQSESWIPINKNLWSLTFVLILASFAYIILTIFYLTVDVYQLFTGEPWLWLGMNSIVIYVGHDLCGDRFPVQFKVGDTHAQQLAMDAYGVTIWMIIAGLMYYTKTFIAI